MSKGMIEKLAEAPSVAIEETITLSETIVVKVKDQKPLKKAKGYWHMLGPGLTTGAADDDPSGIATYSQTGAQSGFRFLWLAGFTFPLMAVIQEMCARIGYVTGRGLASNIRLHFPKKILYLTTILLIIANTFNIGADLGAMAKSVQLIYPDAHFGISLLLISILCLTLQIFMEYRTYAKFLKWLALILLSYIFSTLMIKDLDWNLILKSTLIPSLDLSPDSILLVGAILGTTISPYLFFWQTSQEVEEDILMGNTSIKSRQAEVNSEVIHSMRVDVWSGMFFSNLIMFFIILAAGATLHVAGITTIGSAQEAAEALRPLAGDKSFFLFALGIIGTGMLAVPVLAGSTAYALAESLKWKVGLYRKLKDAHAFYGVIIFSMLIGFALNFSQIDPIKALFYSAVANGLIAPVILTMIVIISSKKAIMGEYVNHPLTTFVGVIATLVMFVSAGASLYIIFLG